MTIHNIPHKAVCFVQWHDANTLVCIELTEEQCLAIGQYGAMLKETREQLADLGNKK